MSFFAFVTSRADLAHLSVLGELDAFTALKLRRPIGDALAQGCRHFTVDVGDLTFIDAGGLGALVGLRNAAHSVDGSLIFLDASPQFRRTCTHVGLADAFRLV